jgi:hypothetical protein
LDLLLVIEKINKDNNKNLHLEHFMEEEVLGDHLENRGGS